MFQDKKVAAPASVATKYIQGLIKAKMLIQKDHVISAKINYENGKLEINDLPPNMQALEVTKPVAHH